MKQRWKIWLLIVLAVAMCLAGCGTKNLGSVTASAEEQVKQEKASKELSENGSLTVSYLDVGQGNAILAESEGHYMFIDGGPRESSSFVVSYLKKQGIEKLDYILISHFDEDHLAGAIGVLHNFSVETLITPDYQADSAIYQSYEAAVKEQGHTEIHPSLGDTFQLGSAEFRIISPTHYGHEDENQDSVGIILENGSNRFYIGGDVGLEGEKEILEAGVDLQADVCLMNHHGSHVSREFFQAISPSYAVISCGEGNSYGHPRKDTTQLIESFQVPLFRTDKQGTVLAKSDGKVITFEQEPCNDCTPGNRGTGKAEEADESAEISSNASAKTCDFVLNTHTKKIHLPSCTSLKSMNEDNKAYYKGEKETLLQEGYTTCKNCME